MNNKEKVVKRVSRLNHDGFFGLPADRVILIYILSRKRMGWKPERILESASDNLGVRESVVAGVWHRYLFKQIPKIYLDESLQGRIDI